MASLFKNFIIIIIIITCLGLADASWPQSGDNLAVSMGTAEEMVLFVWLIVLVLRSTPDSEEATKCP